MKRKDLIKLIKRVIAIPGDHLIIKDSKVYINGEVQNEPYIHNEYTSGDIDIIIPENKIFTMGDNREKSLDSRYDEVGLVDEDDLMGKVSVRLYPLNRIGFVN